MFMTLNSKTRILLLAILFISNGAWATPLTFSYDVLGRLSEFTLPSGNVVTYNYDGNNNVRDTNVNILPDFDLDYDGIPSTADNCSAKSNIEQIDTDKDGKGDACDSLNWGQFMAGYYSTIGNKDGTTTEQFMIANGLSSATQITSLPATVTNAIVKTNGVSGLFFDAGSNRLYFAEQTNNLIRHVTLSTGQAAKLAGSGSVWMSGYVDATGLSARFKSPQQVAASPDGNWLYVADSGNCAIRRINTATAAVSTVAGIAPCANDPQINPNTTSHQDGAAQNAKFYWPRGVAVAADGTVYVGDSYNSAVRKISTGGVVTTLAGGPGNSIGMSRPNGLAIIGNDLYVADGLARVVWKINVANGSTTVVVGKLNSAGSKSGVVGSQALLTEPMGVAGSGTTLFVADQGQNAVLQIDIANSFFTSQLVGGSSQRGFVDGAFASAKLDIPQWLAFNTSANMLYVSDYGNYAVRKLSLGNKTTATVMGLPEIKNKYVDGDAAVARFDAPSSIAAVDDYTLLVADTSNCVIRKLALNTNYGKVVNGKFNHSATVSTFAGTPAMCATWQDGAYPLDGSDKSDGTSAIFYNPTTIITDRAGTFAYVAGDDRSIRRVALNTASGSAPGATHIVAGAPLSAKLTPANAATVSPNIDGIGLSAKFSQIKDLVYANTVLYVITPTAVRQVSLATADYGKVTTLFGHPSEKGDQAGVGTNARFTSLARALTFAQNGAQYLFVTDDTTNKLYALNLDTLEVSVAAGNGMQSSADGIGGAASFNAPTAITRVSQDDNAQYLYISDAGSSKLRSVDLATWEVTTVAGSGGAGALDGVGLASDWSMVSDLFFLPIHNRVFVTDTWARSIRQLTPDLPK
jgi:YD repeat-containing protein